MRRRQSARDKHNVRKEEIWKKKELLFRAAAPMGSAGAPAASSSSVSRCAKYQQAAPKLNSGGTCKKKTGGLFLSAVSLCLSRACLGKSISFISKHEGHPLFSSYRCRSTPFVWRRDRCLQGGHPGAGSVRLSRAVAGVAGHETDVVVFATFCDVGEGVIVGE
jgi:hypothetical protein